jgi:hypothetical protein
MFIDTPFDGETFVERRTKRVMTLTRERKIAAPAR